MIVKRSALILFLLITLSPALALAQGDEMSVAQIELLNQANSALGADPPRLDEAEAVMGRALDEGARFDVLLLTLGRIYQKQDKCPRAQAVFDELDAAPHESSVSKADIARVKSAYMDQMEKLCSAIVTFECSDESVQIQFAGEARRCGIPIKVKAGSYEAAVAFHDARQSIPIKVKGAERERVSVLAIAPPARQIEASVDEESFGYKRTTISAGSTLVASSIFAGVYLTARGKQDRLIAEHASRGYTQEEIDAINAIGRRERIGGFGLPVVFSLGVAATTSLFLVERGVFGDRADRAPVSFSLTPSRSGAAGSVLIRW